MRLEVEIETEDERFGRSTSLSAGQIRFAAGPSGGLRSVPAGRDLAGPCPVTWQTPRALSRSELVNPTLSMPRFYSIHRLVAKWLTGCAAFTMARRAFSPPFSSWPPVALGAPRPKIILPKRRGKTTVSQAAARWLSCTTSQPLHLRLLQLRAADDETRGASMLM